jgi:hypothetical protein
MSLSQPLSNHHPGDLYSVGTGIVPCIGESIGLVIPTPRLVIEEQSKRRICSNDVIAPHPRVEAQEVDEENISLQTEMIGEMLIFAILSLNEPQYLRSFRRHC